MTLRDLSEAQFISGSIIFPHDFSGQGLAAGVPPYLRCEVFLSIEARKRTLRKQILACMKFSDFTHVKTFREN